MKLIHFFYMDGYGFYVWSAYAFMLIVFMMQWFIPWRQFRKLQQKNKVKK